MRIIINNFPKKVYYYANMCIVDTQIEGKINHLLREWPSGTVATMPWLAQMGVGRFLARAYVKGGWIKPLGRGAFVRTEGTNSNLKNGPLWTGGLYSLQSQLNLPIHAGGETALRLNGYGHTAPMNSIPPLYLFGPGGSKLPSWFRKHKWNQEVRFKTTDFLPYSKDHGFTIDSQNGYPITLSSPERAILESLLLMPRYTTFEGATHLMESLSTLRPEMVVTLLKACKSVKVKRTFLYIAEQVNHAWFMRLNLSNVDLGKGKRVVVPGGKFDSKYGITVAHKPQTGDA